jgi:salicylate hydroxylase
MTAVAVVGAGIGGLATALALHDNGIEVAVFEQAPQLEPVGAGIQLSANATRVLAKLDVLADVVATAFEPKTLDIIDGRSGRILLSAQLDGWARNRYGAPYLNIHRGDLQAVLLNAVKSRIPDGLRLGKRVLRVDQNNDAVTLEFETGDCATADVAIAADGVHSVLREHVTAVERARFTGHVAYRMLVTRSEMSDGHVPPPSVCARLGPRGHVVSYWVRSGAAYNIVAAAENDHWREEGWRIPADIDEVRAAFRDWDPSLHALFDGARDVHKWALLDHSVPGTWSRGRVALLGDSCHAMLPYLAQGGAMAIEDAWVLAAALAEEADASRALTLYSQRRVGRATRVHAGAARNARTFHLAGPHRMLRDTALRLMARRPQTFVKRMDWLYGFDATAFVT